MEDKSIKSRRFSRETPEHRKEELILAALRIIAIKGVRAATVRAIALEANVTQGLIRHYFISKDELIVAAYEYHMLQLTEKNKKAALIGSSSAKVHLAKFIIASLSSPVVGPQNVALWAGFFHLVPHNEKMCLTHEKTYLIYRDCVQELISAVFDEVDRGVDDTRLRQYAIVSNAVIDGLWLEGGALPEAFIEGELAEIALRSIGAIIGVDLREQLEHE